MKATGFKLQGFTILAEIIQKYRIECKAASSSLLEKPSSRSGWLGEEFILRCTPCYFENNFTVQLERFHQ